jgi:hypothetical protein
MNITTTASAQTASHTPGPWRMVEEGGVAYVLNHGDRAPQGIISITLKGAGMNYSEAFANARLIAAAPDMLEVLKLVLQWAKAVPHPYREFDFITKARAVIAAATASDQT